MLKEISVWGRGESIPRQHADDARLPHSASTTKNTIFPKKSLNFSKVFTSAARSQNSLASTYAQTSNPIPSDMARNI